jgi:hypothetical protein
MRENMYGRGGGGGVTDLKFAVLKCSGNCFFFLKYPQKLINLSTHIFCRSMDSSVGIATGYGMDDQGVGVRVTVGSRINPFSTSSRPALACTQPPTQWIPEVFSLGVKRLVRVAHHSLYTSVEVKKMWIYTSTPPYVFMA